MNREIKFRAWDGKRYYYFSNHAYTLSYNDISGWNVAPNIPDYKGNWTTGESSDSADDFILEQFTGLKDKNGKEIYEGDILRNEGKIGIVVWYDAAFALESPGSKAIDFVHSSIFEECSIIGNIHENKELLS